MSIPKPNETEIAEVEGELQEEARAKATAPDTAVAVKDQGAKEVAVAEQKAVEEPFDPIAFLAALGIEDIELDFSSFPTVVLNSGKFEKNKAEFEGGDEFEFVYMKKYKTYLITASKGRDDENPILIYSADGKTANKDGRTIDEWRADWDADSEITNVGPLNEYVIVMAKQVGGDDDGSIIQLQLPPTSIHPFNGYLVTLAMARKNPMGVVTRASIGDKLGKGTRTWNPWAFKCVS